MSAVSIQARAKWGRAWIKPQPIAIFVLLVAVLALGGGTRPGLPSDFFVRLLSWPILIVTAALFIARPELRRSRPVVFAALAIFLVPLFQLIPLPPWLWSSLPGREALASSLRDGGLRLGWRPMTMDTARTWGSLASLAAPIAAFLLVLQLTFKERRALILGLIAFGVVSVVLGFLQLSQGESSPLRFYAITNPNQAVGFFANRNHFSALLYMLIPPVAAWVLATALKIRRSNNNEIDAGAVVLLAILVGSFAIILLAQGMATSRAGLGLAGFATLLSFALMVPLRNQQSELKSARYLIAAVVIGIVLISEFALVRIFQRTDLDQVDQYRAQFTQETWRAAKSYLPFGSGMGTFVPVYFSIEKPANVTSEYVNRAHNDFVETWLEAGVVAPIVVLAFLGWWFLRLIVIWHKPLSSGRVTDGLLARAASISIILPVLHSAVDYPLRTSAISTLFAVMAGMLVDPSGRIDPETEGRRRSHRKRSRGSSPLKRTHAPTDGRDGMAPAQ